LRIAGRRSCSDASLCCCSRLGCAVSLYLEVAVDGEDIQHLDVKDITDMMQKRHNQERLLTVITSIHTESKSVSTL